ncbi:methyltransferase domain-containing protein [Paraconexibacter sp.]|uniref:methyltransferase domain-containing protein n=1 Tax=Paraconexibacter sp. TaxID=2949640 RepID=UPI003568A8A9
MAQPLIRSFVEDLAAAVPLPDPIVEFGALQVEEHQDGDLRPLFAGRPFTGVDMRPGPGVDRIEDLRSLSDPDGSVGTALCLDTLEHCEDPPQACRELTRVTADGGVCVLSSVMLFGIHGYPNDYFRFTPEAFRSMLAGFDDVWAAGIGHPDIPTWVVAVGARGRRLDLSLDSFPSLREAQDRYDRATGKVRVGPLHLGPLELARLIAKDAPRLGRERLHALRGGRS